MVSLRTQQRYIIYLSYLNFPSNRFVRSKRHFGEASFPDPIPVLALALNLAGDPANHDSKVTCAPPHSQYGNATTAGFLESIVLQVCRGYSSSTSIQYYRTEGEGGAQVTFES